jgi:hypothetical protein
LVVCLPKSSLASGGLVVVSCAMVWFG